jgi:hypothetical protein
MSTTNVEAINALSDNTSSTLQPGLHSSAMPMTPKVQTKAPPGYKLVKVRMPDGNIKTFKRKLEQQQTIPDALYKSKSSALKRDGALTGIDEESNQASINAGTWPSHHHITS